MLKPLIDDLPLLGGVQLFFLEQPTVNFDLGGAASILDLPGLSSLLKDAIADQIGQHMLLPNKLSFILSDKVCIFSFFCQRVRNSRDRIVVKGPST